MELARRICLATALLSCSVGALSQEIIDFVRSGIERAIIIEAPGQDLYSIGALGDINADGFADLLLTRAGPFATEIVLGHPVVPGRMAIEDAPLARMRVRGPDPSAPLYSLDAASVGDVDGDGVQDCLMGFPELRFPGKSRGAAFLVHGEAGDPKADVFLDEIGTVARGCRFISSDPSHDSLGVAVESIGDFNGDGIGDLAISAPFAALPEERTPGMDHRGQLFIVFGGEHLVGVIDVACVSGKAA